MARLISAIFCVFIPVYICLTIAWLGGLLLAVAWMIYVWILGLTSESLFILGSLTGLIISPIFPLSFGWISQKLNVVPTLLGLLLCGATFGSLVLQKIAGKLLFLCTLSSVRFLRINCLVRNSSDNRLKFYVLGFVMDDDPNYFPTLLAVCVVLPIMLYIVANVITFFHERKLKHRQNSLANYISLKPHNFCEEESQLANYLQDDTEKL